MEYLILWFDIDGKSYAAACSKKGFRCGKIVIRSKKDGKITINKKNITECNFISRFNFSKERSSYLKWEDRNKLFEKYPELKQLCA